MGFRCGIVGLPNVGKSTIFNAMTAAGAAAANYPFCTIEPNVGVVPVPDERLDRIASFFRPPSVVPTTIEFIDIAGLVKGASQGEGLGNQFLGHIRNVDAIAHIVRCFEDPDVVHVHGEVDPGRDIEVIETELILADLDAVGKQIQKNEKKAKGGDQEAIQLQGLLERLQQILNQGQSIRSQIWSHDEQELIRPFFLITAKPFLYVANVSENEILNQPAAVRQIRQRATAEGTEVVAISGKIESEIVELPPEERRAYLSEIGLKESGLNQLARAGYKLLGLLTFFTAGEKEVRAWTVPQGTKAPQAAGVIHSDFEKGFIRAECYHYNDLITLRSEAKVREAGKMRLEGREYVVKDGDIFFFRFNV